MPTVKKVRGGSPQWVPDIQKMYAQYGMFDWVRANVEDKALMKEFLKHRVNHISEEKRELDEALETENAEEIVDAMIDLCVLSLGTLELFGVDSQRAWDEVLKANLAKQRGVKSTRPNRFGLPDLVKPEGWKGPDHSDNHGLFTRLFVQERAPSQRQDRPDVDDTTSLSKALSKGLSKSASQLPKSPSRSKREGITRSESSPPPSKVMRPGEQSTPQSKRTRGGAKTI